MKKLISLFLASMMLLPLLVSCAGGEKADNVTETPATTEAPDAAVDSPISTWLGHSYDKIRIDQRKPSSAAATYTVYAAKGETEGVHLGIYSEGGAENLKFKILSGENENVTVQAYSVLEALKLGRKRYIDPCVPIMAGSKSFDVDPKTSYVILVEFTTTENTPAGDYKYEVAVTDKKGEAIYSTHEITLHVWDFSMPVDLTFESAVGCGGTTVTDYEECYNFLLEHNMSAYNLPFDILDERADAYMSDPRVTSFIVPHSVSDSELTAIYEKLCSNPEWLKKAFFYPLDEPSTLEKVQELEKLCERLRRLCPEIRITSPYYKNVQITPEMDQIDHMAQYLDLHCPKLANWDEDQIYEGNQASRYPSFDDRMKALQDRGDTVWAYVCNYPKAPYLNVKVDDEGIGSRVLFWQMYQRDVEGFLYWSSTYYMNVVSPWNSLDTFGDGIYGDGILLYPGLKVGIPGPVASIRLKYIRDGIDDIELLYLAEELFGREWADERVNKTTTSLTSVDVTSDEFYDIRIEIGNAIEAGLNK